MANPKKKPYSLTPKQRLFVTEYVRSQNASEAARIAGLRNPGSQGSRMLKNPRVQAAIGEADADLRAQFVREATMAFRRLVNLMEESPMDLVRLKAAQDILDRAGYKPVEKREITGTQAIINTSIDYDDPDAVLRRLKELQDRISKAEEIPYEPDKKQVN